MQTRSGHDIDIKIEQPVIHEAHSKPEAVQRNKRLFGNLMGHLGRAKRKLEEDSLNIKKQAILQSAVAQRNAEESKRLLQRQMEITHAEKEKVRFYNIRSISHTSS
jgi:hypothetical protein